MRSLRYLGALVLTLTLAIPVAASEEATPLLEAMAYLHPKSDPVNVSFVDWAQLKRLHGGEDITSGSPLQERQRLMLDIVHSEAAPMELGIDRLATWPEAWGWDNTDLDWEAHFSDGRAVLRFGDHWDPGPFRDALADFGYGANATSVGEIWVPGDDAEMPTRLRLNRLWGGDSSGPDTSAPVTPVTISADGRTVVVHPFGASVPLRRLRLASRPDLERVADTPAVRAAAVLGHPVAADVAAMTPRACRQPTADDLEGRRAEDYEMAAALNQYGARAAGYTRTDATMPAEGRFAFSYPRPWRARDDLAGRSVLVESDHPWELPRASDADPGLGLSDARVEGTELILDVDPAYDDPKRLLSFTIGWAPFAMCGPVADQST